MNNINYTGKWALDISKMDKAEWDQLVSICDAKGIVMYRNTYDGSWSNLICAPTMTWLVRIDAINAIDYEQVSLLQMLNLLEAPLKSPSQIKIEELQETIKLANDQIEALKELQYEVYYMYYCSTCIMVYTR